MVAHDGGDGARPLNDLFDEVAHHGAPIDAARAWWSDDPLYTFTDLRAETPDVDPATRARLAAALEPDLQDQAWRAIKAEVDAETERARRDPLLYEEWPPKSKEMPHSGGQKATRQLAPGAVRSTTQSERGAGSEDPLKRLNLRWAIETLTGAPLAPRGNSCCPLPDHDDSRPSFRAYPDDTWFCWGCGRGGTLIDFAAALWGIEPRGPAYFELRDRLVDELEGAVDGSA